MRIVQRMRLVSHFSDLPQIFMNVYILQTTYIETSSTCIF